MDYIKAFIVGGIICVIGQVVIDKTRLTPARLLTGYVVLGVFLSLIGVWRNLPEREQRCRCWASATLFIKGS